MDLTFLRNRYGQYISGVYYEKGIGVDKNLDKAKAYFLDSANQDFSDAQAALGILLVDQLHQYDDGREWLNRAAQLVNHLSARLNCGRSPFFPNRTMLADC